MTMADSPLFQHSPSAKRSGWDEHPSANASTSDISSPSASMATPVSDATATSPAAKKARYDLPAAAGTSPSSSRQPPSAGHPLPVRASPAALLPLTSDQKERLEKAKLFAREQTIKIMTGRSGPLPALAALIPTLESKEARALSILSRIYVGSINFELNESHIRALFQQFGGIKTLSMNMDPATGRHKGFCFIEYETVEAAMMALDVMKGSEIGGRQLKVGRPNNFNPNAIELLPPAVPSRLYLANINEHVTEKNITDIFQAFGQVKACALTPDVINKRHRGCGFIEFESEDAAVAAMASMNNFELGGLSLRVSKSIVGGPMAPGMASLENLPQSSDTPTARPANPAIPSSVLDVASTINSNIAQRAGPSGPTGLGGVQTASNGVTAAALAAAKLSQEELVSLSAEENVTISSSQRSLLMQKLSRTESQISGASTVIVLENMVTAEEVDDVLEEEIRDEAGRYGSIKRVVIKVQPNDADVAIYVAFETIDGAQKARQALDKRFFGGRQVHASFFDAAAFAAL
ncbi:uncharacterized protein BJ171DRAFT_491974 [Polychytrium aggregatum]|uniref:uncharacterized protein n=1 Tax=Polychytrium aggregatum TaxID=110093 RepID=UPI0022FE32E0|nr:uncharacterized protein BJ171DRAFT_491974 [Polychytrium aggregatum]KAI9207909.1 hypothetical protein BJ171DRAFT_491974 [Polychytrium aggregatum]